MARQRWDRRIEFFLTTVGYSVGVGDLWRFPYLVMKNGGGAFLIPIVVFNIVGAIPIVYLEMMIGQYSQSGAVTVWSFCPILKGVGIGTIIVTFLVAMYYAVFIAMMLFYFVHSFFDPLPWASCDNEWNINETCVVAKNKYKEAVATVTTMTSTLSNVTTTTVTTVSSTLTNMTTTAATKTELLSSAEQFFSYKALNASPGLHHMGNVNWIMFGCVIAIEVLCFFCIFKGVKFSGKAK